ncbi:MAG: gliding motility protein GldC [Bacteroidia bacterium]
MKISEIKFTIGLDERNHPEAIHWQAPDSGSEGVKPCKSVMISLWDSSDNGTLRIDLWTKQMPVDEMQRFFYETFISMADTYQRATGEKEAAANIREFATQFGKTTKVLK